MTLLVSYACNILCEHNSSLSICHVSRTCTEHVLLCWDIVYRQSDITAEVSVCLDVYLNIVLLKASLEMADTVLQAVGVDRQSYSVGMLCAMIQPMHL